MWYALKRGGEESANRGYKVRVVNNGSAKVINKVYIYLVAICHTIGTRRELYTWSGGT